MRNIILLALALNLALQIYINARYVEMNTELQLVNEKLVRVCVEGMRE